MDQEKEKWISTNEAAEYLGMSKKKLYAEYNKVPLFRVGSKKLVTKYSILDKWLLENKK